MGRIDRKRARRAAERDVRIGWLAGSALAALQIIAAINFLMRSAAPVSWLGGYAVGRCLLIAVLLINLYRRRDWAAVMLLGLLVLDVAISWTVVGRLAAPASGLSLFLGYGVYRGMVGTESLASEPVESLR